MNSDDRRSPCPIACTLDILGDRWTLLVLRDLFLGKSRFDEFLASPERISTNILSDRLRRLQAHGMLRRIPYDSRRKRMQYELTERGRSLAPVLKAVRRWGLEHIADTSSWGPTDQAERDAREPGDGSG